MGSVTNVLESQVTRMSKNQDQHLKKAKCICNYPLGSCSTTVYGRQPSEHDIEDSMDIGENENAVIILPNCVPCDTWEEDNLCSPSQLLV
jgi:hypothetical protein